MAPAKKQLHQNDNIKTMFTVANNTQLIPLTAMISLPSASL